MNIIITLSVFCTFCICFCVAVNLEKAEYAAMPPLYHLDSYEECFFDPGALYCDVNFGLVSEGESPLFNTLKQYSLKSFSLYNHSNLDYGICVTRTCKNTTGTNDTKLHLESCLNDTFWKRYKLRTRVQDMLYCSGDDVGIDVADVVVAAVILAIIAINIVGNLSDFFGIKYCQEISACFSIRKNWKELIAPIDENLPPLKRLKTMNGLRAISMVLVICVHSMLPLVNYIANPHFIEDFVGNYLFAIIFNGAIIMQSFFIFSGCLLVTKFCLDFEKRTLNLMTIPDYIYNRWLRLTVPYALVLAVTSTWMRHLGSGPLWQRYVENEVKDCRSYWWRHLLYINNYYTGSQCMGQTWYLATDMQLYCTGVIVFVLFKTLTSRKLVLFCLLIIGCLFRMWNTYYYDLDDFLILKSEESRFFFQQDKTFINMYVLGYTNLPGYVIGLTLGYILYSYRDHSFTKHKKYRYIFWVIPLLILGIIYSGRIFNVLEVSVYVKSVYSALSVVVYGMLIVGLICGCIFKIEDSYRSILEWNGWTIPSRLNYGAYVIHVSIVRYFAGTKQVLLNPTYLLMVSTFWSVNDYSSPQCLFGQSALEQILQETANMHGIFVKCRVEKLKCDFYCFRIEH